MAEVRRSLRKHYRGTKPLSADDFSYWIEESNHLYIKVKNLESWFKSDSNTDINRHFPAFHWVATEWEENGYITEETTTQEILEAYFKAKPHQGTP